MNIEMKNGNMQKLENDKYILKVTKKQINNWNIYTNKIYPNICDVYVITNVQNGKMYIGQSWQGFKYRFLQHLYGSHSTHLMNAFEKYGRHNFTIELLEQCYTQEKADEKEIYYIELFDSINNGYNLKGGGKFGKPNEFLKQKLKAALNRRYNDPNYINPNIGKKDSDDVKKRKSEARVGIKFTDKHKKNISKGKMNAIVSEETRLKMSKSQTGRKASEETLAKMRCRKDTEEVKDKKSKAATGDGNSQAKLNWNIVKNIRALYAKEKNIMSFDNFANKECIKYNISNQSIRNVIKYRTWKE